MVSHILPQVAAANVLAVVFFIVALYRPNAARVIAGAGLILAALVNCVAALRAPLFFGATLEPLAWGVYRDFIHSVFAQAAVRLLLAIALWQAVVGCVFLIRQAPFIKLACVAAFCFFLLLVPLGAGSGFPSTLILASAMVVLFFRKWPSPEASASEPRVQ
jgi:hypothetical protein